MIRLMGALAFLTSVYMMIITIRIILTWFGGIGQGGFQSTLAKITDPYLDWFRRFPVLRTGFLDFSPIVALGVLSLVNRIFGTLARYGTISLGIILAMVLQAVWGAVSFFLGFLIIILLLRLAAHFFARSINSPFWRVIDSIARPVLYKISRVLFKNRIVNFINSVIVSAAALGICHVVLGILVGFLSRFLVGLPV